MHLTLKNTLIFCVLFLTTQISLFSQTIVYVRNTTSGLNNGTSWSNAFSNLSDAINAAPANAEIWIARSSYSVTKNNVQADRIRISKPLSLIGGFAGNEVSKSELLTGYSSAISGDIGDITLPDDNSSTGFQIKNAHVRIENIVFMNFFPKNNADNTGINSAVVADTNSTVDIINCVFSQNIGSTSGTCIAALKGSTVNVNTCSLVNNVQTTYAALISRNDDAVINVSNSIISNNGNTSSGGYIFYSLHTPDLNNTLQAKNLLNVDNTSFNNNNMSISFSSLGSSTFNTCTFNINATNTNIFNQGGDSSTFSMNGCTINGTYKTDLFYMGNVKSFNLENTTIFNPTLSKNQFLYINAHKLISISNSSISNAGGSVPMNLFALKGTVSLNNFSISNADVSSYILYIHTNKLSCTKLQLKDCKGMGSYLISNKASFNKCVIDGFQGDNMLDCRNIPTIAFDSCTFKNIHQSQQLFSSDIGGTLAITNCSISSISMSGNNTGLAILFSVWDGQTLFAANNRIDNIFTSGNLIDNNGDMFVANCTFEHLFLQNSKSVFNNSKKLWVYNSNISANYNIPFLNDTSYYSSKSIEFRAINNIVYTIQDTVVKNKAKPGIIVSDISNNISNKKISGANSVSDCAIPYNNLYDEGYSIIYNKGLTPAGITQYPVIDLYGNPRVFAGSVDIGIKEYQLTTAILKAQSNASVANIYPNPAQGLVHIQSIDNGSLSIVDGTGNVFYTARLETGENIVDISQLHAGIYFVSVSIQDDTVVKKLIVSK